MCLFNNCGCNNNAVNTRCCRTGSRECDRCRCRAFENAVINAAAESITGCSRSRNSCNSCNCSESCSEMRCRAFENAVINVAAANVTGCGCSGNNENSSCNGNSETTSNRQCGCNISDCDYYYIRQYALFNDGGCCSQFSI